MRKRRKELEQELNLECNARMLAELRHRHQVDENIRLQQRLNELLDENNGLRKCMNSNAKEICRLRNMMQQQAQEERTSDEYIDGYADAMQDMEKFLEEKKNLRAEVGSDH